MAPLESSGATTKSKRAVEIGQMMLDKLDRLFDAANPEAVFAAPVSSEGHTVIGAAEVLVWAGVGGGGGGGSSPAESSAEDVAASTDERPSISEGEGFGGGGGGNTLARPVAVIVIDRDGVRVQPVVDVTKLGLAAITALGGLFFMISRMSRAGKEL